MAFDLRNRFARAGAELLVDETELALRCLFFVYNTICLGSHQPNSAGTEPDREKVRSRFRVIAPSPAPHCAAFVPLP